MAAAMVNIYEMGVLKVNRMESRTKAKDKWGGCTDDHACHSHQIIDIASLQSRDGARRVFAGPGLHSITKREAPCTPRGGRGSFVRKQKSKNILAIMYPGTKQTNNAYVNETLHSQ